MLLGIQSLGSIIENWEWNWGSKTPKEMKKWLEPPSLIIMLMTDLCNEICWWQFWVFFTDFLMVLFSGRMYYRSCLTMLIVHQHPKIDTNTESSNLLDEVTVMLVTSLCWWLYDGDRFEMLVAESLCWRLFSLCWWFSRFIKWVTNILNRSPTSQTCNQHIWSPTSVTNCI